MIKINKGRCELEGTPAMLSAELSALVNSLKEAFAEEFGNEVAERLIMNAVKAGLRDIEEIKAEVKEKKENLADLLGMLSDVLRGKEPEEEKCQD